MRLCLSFLVYHCMQIGAWCHFFVPKIKPQMEMRLGKEVVNAGREYMSRSVRGISFHKLHPYFNVSNTYVLRKLLLLIFPFKNKDWDTILHKTGSLAHPDLYIPIMGFITYILAKGLLFGIRSEFRPEKLGLVATRSLFLEGMFVLISKLVAYFIDILDLNTLDMVAFSGYKYVIIVLMFLLRMRFLTFFLKIYLNLAFFFFLSRSMKGIVFGSSPAHKKRKVYFLFMTVFMQIMIVVLHSYFF
jgi:hypothetical protein